MRQYILKIRRLVEYETPWTIIPFVTRMETENFYRNESLHTNLEGDEIVYRGVQKTRLLAGIALANQDTVDFIDRMLSEVFVEVEYKAGGFYSQTKTMRIRPYTKPSPMWRFGRDYEAWYPNIALVIEER